MYLRLCNIGCYLVWFSWAACLPQGVGAEPVAGQQGVASAAGPMVARVMSFNIRYNNPQDGPNAWPHRRDHVAAIVRSQDVDIAGLQEALRDQIADLQERLPEYQWYGVGRDDGQQQGEFVPIFYRADRWTVRAQGNFWLSQQPDQPGRRDWGAACARMVTWLELEHKPSGKRLVVLNTHFDHQSAEARREGAGLLLRRLGDYSQSPVVVTGDLNCDPSSEPYRILTGTLSRSQDGLHLQDSFSMAELGHIGPQSTWNGFRAIVPDRRIDFVLVAGPIGVRQHRILPAEREGRFASDHLPVLAELTLP